MKLELICAWNNLLKLFKFLVLYAGGVALLLWLLPKAALFLQDLYDAMSGLAKIAAVLVFFLSVTSWQLLRQRREQE